MSEGQPQATDEFSKFGHLCYCKNNKSSFSRDFQVFNFFFHAFSFRDFHGFFDILLFCDF